MPNKDYAVAMARYNMWQNENLIAATNTLAAPARRKDRGSFFGSIEATFAHLYWADRLWMSRFSNTPAPDGGIPQSSTLPAPWDAFTTQRQTFDQEILSWAHNVTPSWFEGDLSWFSGAVNRDVTKPKSLLILQLFNHQTHHRGQIHAMLTAAGARPDDTDIPFMPDHFSNL